MNRYVLTWQYTLRVCTSGSECPPDIHSTPSVSLRYALRYGPSRTPVPTDLCHVFALRRAIRECYTVAIFARVLKSKLSDTSSLYYPPLRYVPMQNVCTIILHFAFCILHLRVSVSPLRSVPMQTIRTSILHFAFCILHLRVSVSPLRYVPMQNICTIILHSAFCILHSRVSVLPLPHLLDLL